MVQNERSVPIPSERKMELGLMFSHTCNITCRHCGILSSPYNKNKMKLADARRWIEDAARIPIIKKINFTGGEPFLFQNEHAELFALCKSLGLATRVVTNGFWARSVDSGMKVLSRMKEAGLTELNFSADIFHLEFLRPETLRNALVCARRLDYLQIVSVVLTSNDNPLDTFSAMYGVPREELLDLTKLNVNALIADAEAFAALKQKILVYYGGLIGLGRAAEYPDDLRWFSIDQMSNAACQEVANKPVIYPDGDFQACCCAGGKMGTFTVGNLHREPLDSLIARTYARSQFRLINTHGPKTLFKAVREVRPDLPLKDHYTSICEMCVRSADGLTAEEIDGIANYAMMKPLLQMLGASAAPPRADAGDGPPPAGDAAPPVWPLWPVS